MDDYEEHKPFTKEEIQFIIDTAKNREQAQAEGTPIKKKWSRKSRLSRQLQRRIFEVWRVKDEIEQLERKIGMEDDSEELLALARKLRDLALEMETTLKNFQFDL